jgi:hypothetical protein
VTYVHAQVRTEGGPKLFRLQVLREDDDWLTGYVVNMAGEIGEPPHLVIAKKPEDVLRCRPLRMNLKYGTLERDPDAQA